MITKMGNLGPPQKATLDLKANRRGEGSQRLAKKDREDSRSDSFERTLGEKLSNSRPDSRPTDKLPPELRESRPPDRAELSETRESRMENKIGRSKDDSKEETSPNEIVKTRSQGESKEATKGLSERQRVMQKFMDSMESEFGIPPQRIVEAMAQLSDKQLLQAPEDTASTVIEQLDLEPQESERAEAMYIAMLGTLGTLPSAQQSVQSNVRDQSKDTESLTAGQKATLGAGGLMAGALPPQLLSSRERREALNNSLDKMNSKFFIKPGEVPQPNQAKTISTEIGPEALRDSGSQNSLSSEPLSQKSQALANYQRTDFSRELPSLTKGVDRGLDRGAEVVPSESQQVADPRLAGLTEQMQPMTEDEANAEILKGLSALGLAAGAISQLLKEDPQNAAALKMEQGLSGGTSGGANGAAASLQAQMQTQGLQGGSSKNGQGSSGEKEKGADREADSGLRGLGSSTTTAPSFFADPGATAATGGREAVAQSSHSQAAQAAGGGAAATAAAVANKSENQANIQQVMNQAKYMIKKGGGEAIVKLSPEGMGQVHLKVVVNEGKVNVEMQTETKEAKKLLESNLMDLKSSMNTHKLAIDHVKVDVGNGMANDNSKDQQQQQQQPQRDLGKEQARQFLGQFREENLANRNGFYETTGIKAYGSSRKTVDPLKPADEAKASALRRYQGSGKGTGVDLVA